ncbi:hypothetical protein GUITHDRAFT_103751 [Guillardia theta CCMP2712]|uniref:RWP-RK domain-containing protein n=2 Tax=Guillardia theta TaxID=55529 RepID=L1JQF0_GUITC|nr:hypothetical protein GUITHDRAFT_103751 [Guillardia theta CCMP2712]EKX50519.1 hypothetical protein GUITHDRAFT_103751 [Guillardia theta CCMP2712]|eukprot:XP_005837499.1 hypothetical protein GUITHDRAFT_103751 [Guillardia theta CCMP2712]
MGISLTAFKSACRRVGLSRWPYLRKHDSVEKMSTSSSSSPASVCMVEQAEDMGQTTFDEAIYCAVGSKQVPNPSLFNDAFLHVAGEWF